MLSIYFMYFFGDIYKIETARACWWTMHIIYQHKVIWCSRFYFSRPESETSLKCFGNREIKCNFNPICISTLRRSDAIYLFIFNRKYCEKKYLYWNIYRMYVEHMCSWKNFVFFFKKKVILAVFRVDVSN